MREREALERRAALAGAEQLLHRLAVRRERDVAVDDRPCRARTSVERSPSSAIRHLLAGRRDADFTTTSSACVLAAGRRAADDQPPAGRHRRDVAVDVDRVARDVGRRPAPRRASSGSLTANTVSVAHLVAKNA